MILKYLDFSALILHENPRSLKFIIIRDKNCIQRSSAKTGFIRHHPDCPPLRWNSKGVIFRYVLMVKLQWIWFILAMVGEFVVQSSGKTRMGGIYDFDRNDGCDGKMIVFPKFRKAKLV